MMTANHIEVLSVLEFVNHHPDYPREWCTPLDIGGHNGSHHSGTLATLARRGLVQFKQRWHKDPEPGKNGVSGRRLTRGSKCYRITPAGRSALSTATGDGT